MGFFRPATTEPRLSKTKHPLILEGAFYPIFFPNRICNLQYNI
nr:MAG TPA: hypothetical protein [Caudoviricetes sp.]